MILEQGLDTWLLDGNTCCHEISLGIHSPDRYEGSTFTAHGMTKYYRPVAQRLMAHLSSTVKTWIIEPCARNLILFLYNTCLSKLNNYRGYQFQKFPSLESVQKTQQKHNPFPLLR